MGKSSNRSEPSLKHEGIPEQLFRLMQSRHVSYQKHERRFRRIFGVSMRPFLDLMTGFDIVRFDDWMKTPDGTSTSDFLRKTYGDEAHDLVTGLLDIGSDCCPVSAIH